MDLNPDKQDDSSAEAGNATPAAQPASDQEAGLDQSAQARDRDPVGAVVTDEQGWAVSPAKATKPKSPFSESTPRLLAMLGHAILAMGFNRIPLAKRQFMISFFGMVALVTPLILWISWTKVMLLVFSGIGMLSVGALLVIVWLSPEDEL